MVKLLSCSMVPEHSSCPMVDYDYDSYDYDSHDSIRLFERLWGWPPIHLPSVPWTEPCLLIAGKFGSDMLVLENSLHVACLLGFV